LAEAAIEYAGPAIKARCLIPRFGQPSELKCVAVFLASDASSYTTGQIIIVDSGRTIV
jgi:NAD(P)-dependent dehydrogenase (short-subunit alcohol dehydrogenase family)